MPRVGLFTAGFFSAAAAVFGMSRVLWDAVALWGSTPPYADFPCSTVYNRLLPAAAYGKIRGYYGPDGRMRAVVTWGFMTAEEFETRDYAGWEVFAREDGERLVFVDMIAPGGRNDVLMVSRDLRRLFVGLYPHHSRVYAHRGPRNGVFPNKGE